MREKYRGIFKDKEGNAFDEVSFPMCTEDTGAKNTINSYGITSYPDKYAYADMYLGKLWIAIVKRTPPQN